MSHHHHHSPPTLKQSDINRSFIWGIILNIVYVLIELFYGWQQGSTALFSDAVHNIGDISGLLLAFIAFKLQSIQSGKVLTYGYKKVSILASFVNSILLAFAIGAIAWEGIQRTIHPQAINGVVVSWVAFAGVIINFISARLFHNEKDGDLNIKAAYWHLMADALVSLGVVVSGVIIYYTHWYRIDGIVTIIIALVVLYSTWNLFKESWIGVLDGVPASIDRDEIIVHLSDIDGVIDVHHVHIWGISTNENALTGHIKVKDIQALQQVKKAIKEELKEHGISHSTLEFELENEDCNE